jgi:Spy/CpxP family protein refolding chaperone
MGRMGRGRRGPGMLMRLVNNPEMRQRLGITDQQATSIRQKTSAFLKGQIRNRANLRIQRLDLRNLLSAEKPDRAAINTALEQISALQLAQAKAAVNFRLDMRDALTPEQRQKLMQMGRQFMRRGHGRQGMPGRRGPQGASPQSNSGPGPR